MIFGNLIRTAGLFIGALIFGIAEAQAAEISITIDDFSFHDGPMLSLEKRDQNILEELRDNSIKAGLFVRCSSLEDSRIKERLKFWDKAGQLIANHTYNHWSYNKTEFGKFADDIRKCDGTLQKYQRFSRFF